MSEPTPEDSSLRTQLTLLQTKIDQLDKYFDRVVQVIGLVGAAVAVIIPIVTIFFTGRSEDALEADLGRFEEVIKIQAENTKEEIAAIKQRVGLSFGEPALRFLKTDGEILDGSTVMASVIETYADSDTGSHSACGPTEIEGFDQYALEVVLVLENSGDSVAHVDVVRIYTKDIFPDFMNFRHEGEDWKILDLFSFEDQLFFKQAPGRYRSPYVLTMVSETLDHVWCQIDDVPAHGSEHPFMLELYYHNEAGLSKRSLHEFRIVVDSPNI